MSFTLVGYSASVDQAALAAIAALADQHMTVNGNNIVVPQELPYVVGLYGVGVNLTRAQLVAPSLRRMVNVELKPLDYLSEPNSPAGFIDLRRSPLKLDPDENLNVQTSEDGVGATRMSVFVWLADGPITEVEGEAFKLRCTNTTTLVAYAWTLGELTLDQQLPAGEYQVVGMRYESTGGIAARLVFRGAEWRPGVIGCDAVSDIVHRAFNTPGQMGVFGTFKHNRLPAVEFLSASADTSQVVDLDLVKIG